MRTRPSISTREFQIEQPLRSCLEQIASQCSLACCGIDACKITPRMLELWSSSIGKDQTQLAISQAKDIVQLCDDSDGQALSCDVLHYQELCTPATDGDAERTELEKRQDEHRQRLRGFFSALAESLRANA